MARKCIILKMPFFLFFTVILQLVLLAIFLLFFGLPAVQRFLAGEVMVMYSQEASGGIEAPSITASARNSKTNRAWKSMNISPDIGSLLENQCSGLANKTLEQCIVQKTFTQSDVIKEAFLGTSSRTPLLDWQRDFTDVSEVGMSYTLNMEGKIGTDGFIHQIYVLLDYDKTYDIYIHDSKFFAVSHNPNGPPSKYVKINPNTSFNHYNKLALTKHYEMNVPHDPCVQDPDYSFQVN